MFNYNFMNYQVLINYIKGETDAKGYTPRIKSYNIN